MNNIKIRLYGKEINAILLAHFNILHTIEVEKKVLLFFKRETKTQIKSNVFLVFIPFKHQEKELAIIELEDVVDFEQLEGSDILHIENFISPFTKEHPYYNEYKIENFIGHEFIYTNKEFIADTVNRLYEPLEILYKHKPELLQIEIDEELL